MSGATPQLSRHGSTILYRTVRERSTYSNPADLQDGSPAYATLAPELVDHLLSPEYRGYFEIRTERKALSLVKAAEQGLLADAYRAFEAFKAFEAMELTDSFRRILYVIISEALSQNNSRPMVQYRQGAARLEGTVTFVGFRHIALQAESYGFLKIHRRGGKATCFEIISTKTSDFDEDFDRLAALEEVNLRLQTLIVSNPERLEKLEKELAEHRDKIRLRRIFKEDQIQAERASRSIRRSWALKHGRLAKKARQNAAIRSELASLRIPGSKRIQFVAQNDSEAEHRRLNKAALARVKAGFAPWVPSDHIGNKVSIVQTEDHHRPKMERASSNLAGDSSRKSVVQDGTVTGHATFGY